MMSFSALCSKIRRRFSSAARVRYVLQNGTPGTRYSVQDLMTYADAGMLQVIDALYPLMQSGRVARRLYVASPTTGRFITSAFLSLNAIPDRMVDTTIKTSLVVVDVDLTDVHQMFEWVR